MTTGAPAFRRPRLGKGRMLRGANVHHAESVWVQPVEMPEGAGDPRTLLEAIVALEREAARAMGRPDPSGFAKVVRDPSEPNRIELVWASNSGGISRRSARAAVSGRAEHATELLRRARRREWGAGTAGWVAAARERGVPCEPLAGAYVRLGEGALQHVVSAADPPDRAIRTLFPDDAPSRLPVALVAGDRGARAVADELDALLRAAGRAVGTATRRATTIAGEPVERAALGRANGVRHLLSDPRVDSVVHAVAPRRVVRRGLRLDRVAVTAILDPADDPETFRRGIDVAIAATDGAIVVADDHPEAGRLAAALPARRLVLVAPRGSGTLVDAHLAAGGSAVLRAPGGLELRREGGASLSIPGRGLRGRGRRAMFSLALACGLGLPDEVVAAAFERRRFLRGGRAS